MKKLLFSKIENFRFKKEKLKTILFHKIFFKKIGKKTVICNPLRIVNPSNISIGNRVWIFDGLRIETIEKWGKQKFNPKIIIEDEVSMEQHVHITCANKIVIGKGTVMSAWVMITDIDHEYKNVKMSVMKQPLIVRETLIGENCFIGMGARIMSGTRLGKNCVVGTNSVVFGDFPDGSVIVGSPAKIVKKYNYVLNKWEK